MEFGGSVAINTSRLKLYVLWLKIMLYFAWQYVLNYLHVTFKQNWAFEKYELFL